MKKYDLPTDLSIWIESQLNDLDYSLKSPKDLASAILKASDAYQSTESTSNWSNKNFKAAYLAYFMPLNYIRSLKVIDEAKKFNFFEQTNEIIDFGCGPGTATKALLNDNDLKFQSITGIDTVTALSDYYTLGLPYQIAAQFSTKAPNTIKEKSLLILSYTLNELKETPSWFFKNDKIILIEPSTKQASHHFQIFRDELLKNDFQILAPCPHHLQCPLSLSKKDWCHDRVYWNKPDWFDNLEKLLPIKNNSLTFSYLIASKKHIEKDSYIRVVGDAQIEKGKTKWMICQNSEREFMSFLKRDGKAPLIYRGDRIQLSHTEKKGNEIRFNHQQINLNS
jgi:hypothetical protein